MELNFVAVAGCLLAGARIASAFHPITTVQQSRTSRVSSPCSECAPLVAPLSATTIELDESAQRDVFTMQQWAEQCGVQLAEGFQLTSEDGGQEYSVMTSEDLPAGSPVLFVPCQMILSSSNVEYGEELLAQAENELAQAGLGDKNQLFRLFVNILAEYQKGDQSPYFPYLNSLPRRYNNGASMTYACFDCLPPYVGRLAKQERSIFSKFHKVLHHVPFLDGTIYMDRHLVKFAYNVAVTRSFDLDGEKRIAPMADMFDHGAEPEVYIDYDEEGNCIAYTTRDVPAGSPLRISLGDSTNPSPLFATYGFLDESSPGTFAKLLHLQEEMQDLALDYSNLLFYTTGDISEEVWDIMLYSILAFDSDQQQDFYRAFSSGDAETKSSYHQEYFSYTLDLLQKHVDGTLNTLGTLSERAKSYDLDTHPRIPVILQHNEFVKRTFSNVKANLDAMASEADDSER